jgi:hypothetical protein
MTTTGMSPLRVAGAGSHPVAEDEVYQLGAWTAGLESFLSGSGLTYGERTIVPAYSDHIRDLRIARGALQRCSGLAFRVLAASSYGERQDELERANITFEELRDYSGQLRDALLLADSLDRSPSLNLSEWQAWCKLFIDRFVDVPAFAKLAALADQDGEDYLPDALRKIVASGGVGRAEFEAVLPRFGRILRLLNIVRKMLDGDEPLKPALLIFAKVIEQTQDLISYLNHRIERSTGPDEDFVGPLDGASYTASIELKKVINHELAGLTSIRPSTTVYARTESACALLTESFQHILTGFARHFDPRVDAFQLFPTFNEKLQRSLKLRAELFEIVKLVQAAEKSPDAENTSALNNSLMTYMDEALGFLFYKDTETFERFVEEILVTRQKKDLVPILHRFGAYLETLFAQVNMRAVLENHPFEVPRG